MSESTICTHLLHLLSVVNKLVTLVSEKINIVFYNPDKARIVLLVDLRDFFSDLWSGWGGGGGGGGLGGGDKRKKKALKMTS